MKQSGPATQWFSMHPRLREVVQAKLDDGSFFARQERSLAEQPGPERSIEPSGWWTALLRRAANPPRSRFLRRDGRASSAVRWRLWLWPVELSVVAAQDGQKTKDLDVEPHQRGHDAEGGNQP